LSRSESIRHILARHEQGAGFIAHGQARVTGQPAVFFATSGPGATNTITALADAKLDSIPIICITGQVPRGLIGTDAFQEIDTYGLSLPVTKHSFFAQSAKELLEIIPAAFEIDPSARFDEASLSVGARQRNEWLLSLHYGGQNIAYIEDEQGVIVLAVGLEGGGALLDAIPYELRKDVNFGAPSLPDAVDLF